jgi:hypothetical protein
MNYKHDRRAVAPVRSLTMCAVRPAALSLLAGFRVSLTGSAGPPLF